MSSPDQTFDPAWYDAAYREAMAGASDAEAHYRAVGQARGFKPNPGFDPLLAAMGADSDPAVAFADLPHPPMSKADRPRAKEIAKDAALTNAIAETLGREAFTDLPTGGRPRRLHAPAAADLLGRIERDEAFSFARLPHGFWDCLHNFTEIRAEIVGDPRVGGLDDGQIDLLTNRLCDAWFPDRGVFVEHFLQEIMADITAPAPPWLLNAVAFKPFPTVDERPFWRPGPPGAVSLFGVAAFDRAFPADTPIYDANLWKRWVMSGDILRLPKLARLRPIVLVGADRVGDLDRRWDLPWFEHVEIPEDGSYPFRNAILDRCLAAVERAKATAARHGTPAPMVLLQGGSFAYWLILRLARRDPSLFYLDFGQALHAWFLESEWDGPRKWARLHAEPIMRNGFAAFYADKGLTLPDAYAAFA